MVGVTPLHVVIDILHALELSVLQHFAGSTLFMVAFDTALQGPLAERIERTWSVLRQACNERGTPQGERITFALLEGVFEAGRAHNPTRYPVLHSKGAIARNNMPAIRVLFEWLGAQSEAFAHVRAVLENYCLFYDVMASRPIWLPAGAVLELPMR